MPLPQIFIEFNTYLKKKFTVFKRVFKDVFVVDINKGYEQAMNYPIVDRYTIKILWWHFGILVLFICTNAYFKIAEHNPSPFSWRVISPLGAITSLILGGIALLIPIFAHKRVKNHYMWRVTILFGLSLYSYLFVYISGGSIEMHFHYFIVLLLMSVFADWRLGWIAFFLALVPNFILSFISPSGAFYYGYTSISSLVYIFPVFFGAIFAQYISKEHRKALLRQIDEEQRKDEFISVASHELKTPITSQKVFIHMLLQMSRRENNKKYEDLIVKIENQTDNLIRLIRDLLDVSKIESNKVLFYPTEMDINKCILTTVSDFQQTITKHEILLRGKSQHRVFADKDRIAQVISNLLSNAVKYSPQANKIIVEITDVDDQVVVSVQDFGIGIDSGHENKIFDRFFRASGNDERTYPGMGIGLYVCSEIIKRHNGKIWVESKKGFGSKFFFLLPISRSYSDSP